MAFYSQDPNLGELLAANLAELTEQTSADLSELSVTWLVYSSSPLDLAASISEADFWQMPQAGASHLGRQLRYPATSQPVNQPAQPASQPRLASRRQL